MLEPTASPDLVASQRADEPRSVDTVSDEDTTRPGAKRGFIVNTVVSIACPWISVAQVASAVGHSYFLALLMFTLVYVSSGVMYFLAANAEHTFVAGTSPLSAYAAQVVTYLSGPFASLLVAFYRYSNARWSSGMGTLVSSVGELNEQLNARMVVSTESVAYIAADLGLNLVLVLGIFYLHSRLNQRTKFDTSTSCSSTMEVLCCAPCSLFEMAWVAKEAAKKPQYQLGVLDELPAYEGRGLQTMPDKKLRTEGDGVAACPA